MRCHSVIAAHRIYGLVVQKLCLTTAAVVRINNHLSLPIQTMTMATRSPPPYPRRTRPAASHLSRRWQADDLREDGTLPGFQARFFPSVRIGDGYIIVPDFGEIGARIRRPDDRPSTLGHAVRSCPGESPPRRAARPRLRRAIGCPCRSPPAT